MENRISVKDGALVRGGEPVRFRGVSFGSWINIENFMIGLSGVDHQIQDYFRAIFGEENRARFFDSYWDSFITEEDFKFIKGCGFNLIRLAFNYRYFEDGLHPFEYRDPGIKLLDRAVKLCKKYRIYFLLDFHALPGGQNTTPPADNLTGYPMVYMEKHYQERSVRLWQFLIDRYKSEEYLFGYDLMNEPIGNIGDINSFYRMLAKAVREVDPLRPMVIEEPAGNARSGDPDMDLARDLFDDANTVYSFHWYPLSGFSQYPGEYQGKYWDRAALAAQVESSRRYSREVNRPVLIGEFGNRNQQPKESLLAKLDDGLSIMEELGWHWTMWSYKDLKVLGLLNPSPESAWRKFVEREDIQEKRRICDAARKEQFDNYYIPLWGKNRENRLIFDYGYDDGVRGMRRIACWYELTELAKYPLEEVLAMPEAWRFENCVVNKEVLEVYKKYLP
ncbi:MAG: glycoside hydrolase family 5 protein [Bacillota bacterium]